MKKILLTVFAAGMMFSAYSQKLKDATASFKKAQEFHLIQSTGETIKHLNETKRVLDALESDAKVQGDVNFWMTKAQTYLLMSDIPDFAPQNPLKTAAAALDKALQLDKKKALNFSGAKETIINMGFSYFNYGVADVNASRFAEATKNFEEAYRYLNTDNGAVVKGIANAEEYRFKALQMSGTAAYYAEDYQKAVKYLEAAIKDSRAANESNLYLNLANAYGKVNKKDKQLATIQEGKTKFKDDPNIFAAEINYYIDNGETEKVISGLKEQIAKTPDRDDYHYNLGLTYLELVKRNSGKQEELPYLLQAAESFKQARNLKNDNVNYAYYEGTSLYNAAVFLHDQAKNMSDAAKASKLSGERDQYFKQAIPIFQSVVTMYKSKDKSKLTNSDLAKWEQTLKALSRIYAQFNMEDEYKQVQAELEKL